MRKNYKYDFKTDKPKKVDTYVPLDMRCLSSGYFSDAEKLELREDIIGPEAEKLAKIMASLEPELTSTQLRKFFNEVRSIEERLKDDKFQKAPIIFLKSKVAYSVGKKTSKIPKQFKDFIDACVDKINDEKDFYGFVKFFESVVGYFYYYNEENKRQGSK